MLGYGKVLLFGAKKGSVNIVQSLMWESEMRVKYANFSNLSIQNFDEIPNCYLRGLAGKFEEIKMGVNWERLLADFRSSSLRLSRIS